MSLETVALPEVTWKTRAPAASTITTSRPMRTIPPTPPFLAAAGRTVGAPVGISTEPSMT